MLKLLRVISNLHLVTRASIRVETKIRSSRRCSKNLFFSRILTQRQNVGFRVGLAIFTIALLTPSTWAATEKVLYSFNGADGANPVAGLIFDGAGNLYGTTSEGGAHGSGAVFKLSPNGGGGWTETLLYSFRDYPDGAFPAASLIFDGTRILYGTTKYGGTLGEGTVFQLSFDGSGWTEKVLHNFGREGRDRDGRRPEGSLILDAAGNLYGTTFGGGNFVGGTVFQLTPATGGNWTETVLFNFGVPDGTLRSSLIFDAAGNLYGTVIGTDSRSPHGNGMAFRLNRNEGWRATVLHMFRGTDGARPMAGLIFGPGGNLYGTTSQGGGSINAGTAFVLVPNMQGGYTESLLHSFTGSDGSSPEAGLIRDAAGNLYGTTRFGGSDRRGTVFQITP